MKIKIQKLPNAFKKLPSYKTPGSVGMDIHAAISDPIKILPNRRDLVPSGMIAEIPIGYEIQIRPRSGLALKYGITVLNTPGTIDSDYRGEIGVILINHGDKEFILNPEDRIAQMIISRVIKVELEEVNSLSNTQRGKDGFGSTGIKNE